MIQIGAWAQAQEPIARDQYDFGAKTKDVEKNMFYTVRPGNKLTETYFEMGDIESMGEFTGTLNFSDVDQGYSFTRTSVVFAQGIKIERRFIDTDQQDVVNKLPKKLGVSVKRRTKLDVFFPFNNAFNTSITTLDGLQLCSTAHTSNNGGSSQSNYGTSPLSALSVEATRIRMRKFLTNTDQRIDEMNPDMLIVPDDLDEIAWEIISSSGKVDTANNNKNYAEGRYKKYSSIYMNDTNNWFMVDSSLMKECLDWADIVKPEFKNATNFDDYAAKYAAYMHYLYAVTDWRFVLGHEVS